MRYPLTSLLKVRRLREDNALAAVKNAERALALAREKAEQCRKELEDYAAWWRDEEERRYADILFTEMTLEQMASFRQGLGDLRAGEIQRAEALSLAQEEVAAAIALAEQARAALARTRKETQKILTHQDIWEAEEKLAALRREETELEEFPGKSSNASLTVNAHGDKDGFHDE